MKKRVTGIFALALSLFVLALPFSSEAASWQLNNVGWWYSYDNGSYAANGWAFINGSWYHFDQSGYMQTGWQFINGCWYYLTSSGAMAHDTWVGNYYVTSSGAMAVNSWIGQYFVGSDGAWIPEYGNEGWISDSVGWWYRNADGSYPANAWKYINGQWYYFDGSGYMATGWRQVNGAWYYLTGSGAMAHDTWVGDYYLTSSGAMATNAQIGQYYVGADGKWIPGSNGSGNTVVNTNADVVYWIDGGTVYHKTSDCPTLHNTNKTIQSGSIAASGLSRPCKVCFN